MTGHRTFYKTSGLMLAAFALAAGLGVAHAQDEEAPLISPEELALLRAERLETPGDIAGAPQRLFLGNCSACHGTGKVGGPPERLIQVILHGVDRGEPENVSMPGFAASMTDRQVADLVAYLSQASTGAPVEIDIEAVAASRTGQHAILKPPR